MKPFQVEFKEENGTYFGKMGIGCTLLAITWALAALGFVVLGFVKLVLR